MKKYYAYYQKDFGAEAFEIRDEEDNIIVIVAPNYEEAKRAFDNVIDNQLDAGWEHSEEEREEAHDFIISEFKDAMYECAYCKDYNYDDV